MLSELFDKLRSNQSSAANYYDLHDYPFILPAHFKAAGSLDRTG